MNLTLLRDRFPNFSTDLSMAIALTKDNQPCRLKIWFSYNLQRDFNSFGRKVNRVIFSKVTKEVRLQNWRNIIIEFSQLIQRLRLANSEFNNYTFLEELYNELFAFLSEGEQIQLEFNLIKLFN